MMSASESLSGSTGFEDIVESIMEPVWDDDLDIDYVDALDQPPCPRCSSPVYDFDRECRAWVCDDCGLWVDEDEDEY